MSAADLNNPKLNSESDRPETGNIAEPADTAGFYKLEEGYLMYGPNYVLNERFSLYRPGFARRFRNNKWNAATPSERKEPKIPNRKKFDDDWYWFDSESDARAFFGITDSVPKV